MIQRIKLAWAVLTGQEKKYAHHLLGKVYVDNSANNLSDALFLLNKEALERNDNLVYDALEEETIGLMISKVLDSKLAPNEKTAALLVLGSELEQIMNKELFLDAIS